MTTATAAPPLWSDPGRYLDLMDSPWGRTLVTVQDALSYATARFWAARGVPTLHLPVTTGAISSPMGLGSDSQPVKARMFGRDVYLADSMQFALEYGCRLAGSGCYYLMPSFRGEDPDPSHLCQFFHSEAELPGGLDTTMSIMEEYIRYLARHLLAACPDTIRAQAGTLDHLEEIAAGDGPFERITFADAARMLHHDPELAGRSAQGYGTAHLMTTGERAFSTARTCTSSCPLRDNGPPDPCFWLWSAAGTCRRLRGPCPQASLRM
ncbi:amino acid--tRNA ligase-related protein [Streptomyces sp. NPDC001933]|uniref:amino acid--tRNA ligase-related protein n=1 Tax=Streptomyces sp. NPDC001933 TaxID=3364626 RepID=UPI0036B498BF